MAKVRARRQSWRVAVSGLLAREYVRWPRMASRRSETVICVPLHGQRATPLLLALDIRPGAPRFQGAHALKIKRGTAAAAPPVAMGRHGGLDQASPQIASAVLTTSSSLRFWSSGVMALPSSVEAKPHCGAMPS